MISKNKNKTKHRKQEQTKQTKQIEKKDMYFIIHMCPFMKYTVGAIKNGKSRETSNTIVKFSKTVHKEDM